ncbi:unnamed protein product [Protopolystoma xenopodis]|uniref:Anaphase-promoting complex subunit 4 WD40 domain-containing protein n=1 Tax=Protopolystoma xenopodis TaxID=117903 RepID=A0A3S5CRT8_9PLAT|nr:unnamed protein product [Protopolystoma xenopodis]
MHVSGRPTAAFDPEGLIFAAGINSDSIKLYDLRSFDKGPFATFKIATTPANPAAATSATLGSRNTTFMASGDLPGTEWTGLKFSPDGKTLLIQTNGTQLKLIDAFKGSLQHVLTVLANVDHRQPLDACFTPDSQFVLSGCPDGHVQVWAVETGLLALFFFTSNSLFSYIKPVCFSAI